MEINILNMEDISKKKVAIIGAGACGLVTARHLKDIADIQVFETKDDVGGLWNYSEFSEENPADIENDAFYKLYGWVQGSIYKDLVTNNPKHCMTFKDFCISKDYQNTMKQEQFYAYLRDYTEHFSLYDYIKFSTTVKSVKIDETADHRFKVVTVPTDMSEGTEETVGYYDFVLVCNGHHSVPLMPNFEGEKDFEGKILHVHSLRTFNKEDYDDKNILIVGGSLSGCDIAEVLLFAKSSEFKPRKIMIHVRSTHLKYIEGSFPEQSETKQIEFKTSSVSKITKNTVIFEDGTEDSYDIIIYATGYRNCFPFFDPADKIIEFENGGDRGQYFGPLYRKLFSINYPDIIFIGLVERASTLYITFERQALLAKQYILGELQLPSKADMLSSLEDEKKVCIDYHNSLSKFYYIDNTETYSFIDYHRDLCKLTNLPINDHFFQNVIKSEEAVQIIYDTGIACRIKAIDWTSVFGDFDYFSTSDQF